MAFDMAKSMVNWYPDIQRTQEEIDKAFLNLLRFTGEDLSTLTEFPSFIEYSFRHSYAEYLFEGRASQRVPQWKTHCILAYSWMHGIPVHNAKYIGSTNKKDFDDMKKNHTLFFIEPYREYLIQTSKKVCTYQDMFEIPK